MGIYSVWPFFVCMAIIYAIAATPAFKAADTPPNHVQNRVSSVDGLRGFLALGVFFYHGAIYHEYLIDGKWNAFPSRFYPVLGQMGVAMFFMITGYLFWGKLLAEGGRPDWLRLYTGRIFRIGPLYLFMFLVMLVIVFSYTGLQLKVPVFNLVKAIAKGLALGFFKGQPDVNGYPAWLVASGVTWTLRFEWYFYLSLIVTSFIARTARLHLPFTIAGWAVCLAYVAWHNIPEPLAPRSVCCLLFFTGMGCASLEKAGLRLNLPKAAASVLVVLLIGTVLGMFSTANAAFPAVLIGLAFYLILSGANVFGLLAARAARRLGDVSYGIYLLQGLVLALILRNQHVRIFALESPARYWASVLFCALLLVSFATAAHVWIERPGIKLGKQVAAMLTVRRWRAVPGPLGAPGISPDLERVASS